MADPLSRRAFIGTGGLLLSAGVTYLPRQQKSRVTVAHLNTSGGQEDTSSLVIGMTIVRQASTHENYFLALRRRHKYYTDWLYDSTDKFRIPYAVEALKYFLNNRDIVFAARVVVKGPTRSDEARFQFRQTILSALQEPTNIVLKIRGCDHLIPQRTLVTYLQREIPGLLSIERERLAREEPGFKRNPRTARKGDVPARVSSTNCLQLNEFLTSALHRELTATESDPLFDVLHSGLKVQSLPALKDRNNSKFRVVLA